MTIEFMCNSCSTTLRVPKEHIGKQARCPKCKSLNEVQPGAAPIQPAGSPMGQAPIPYSPSGVSPGAMPPGARGWQPHRGGMVLAMGIVSIVCNVALVPGILAWIFGRNDLRAMDAGTMDPEGRGMTQAGMIIGMIMTIFAIIGVVFMICYFVFIFLIVAGAAASGM